MKVVATIQRSSIGAAGEIYKLEDGSMLIVFTKLYVRRVKTIDELNAMKGLGELLYDFAFDWVPEEG